MSKEAMLKRAFNQAITNDAVNFTDREADMLVIRNIMVAYAKKNGISMTVGEIESYIKVQLDKIDESLKDFSYQNKMMK